MDFPIEQESHEVTLNLINDGCATDYPADLVHVLENGYSKMATFTVIQAEMTKNRENNRICNRFLRRFHILFIQKCILTSMRNAEVYRPAGIHCHTLVKSRNPCSKVSSMI